MSPEAPGVSAMQLHFTPKQVPSSSVSSFLKAVFSLGCSEVIGCLPSARLLAPRTSRAASRLRKSSGTPIHLTLRGAGPEGGAGRLWPSVAAKSCLGPAGAADSWQESSRPTGARGTGRAVTGDSPVGREARVDTTTRQATRKFTYLTRDLHFDDDE